VPVEATNAQIVYDKYSVYSDNNEDGIINKGETVGLQVWLKNSGTSAARGVKATFSTTSSYVSGFTPTTQVNYGDISAGNSVVVSYDGYSNYYTIRFTVSSSTPVGAQIPINISITDESGNTWTESFNVPVEATNAQIVYDKYSVYSDNNGDGIINKGETIGLQVWLKNTGTSAAKGVKVIFSTSSMYVSSFTPTTQISYGDMTTGNSKKVDYSGSIYNNDYTIRFIISSSTPADTQIPFNISITDESGNTWMEGFNVPVKDVNLPHGAGTQTWTFGEQTWSGALRLDVPGCALVITLSAEYNPPPQYKNANTGYGYYYNWTCVRDYAATLCPSPWRVPNKEDMQTLVNNATTAILSSSWGYGGHASGNFITGLDSYGRYWSSTESSTFYAYRLYYGSSGSPSVNSVNKENGFQVRCVK
jgi:hypothetical protein